MKAPPRACNVPGCPELAYGAFRCEAHRVEVSRAVQSEYDRRRGSSSARGYDRRWERYRKRYLAQHPFCEHCRDEGTSGLANEVDHIEPVDGPDDPLFWRTDNHQGLCRTHHARKTARERGGGPTEREFGRNELTHPADLPQRSVPLTLVAGAAGSGKTTYAQERAGDDDVVLDLDEIMSELSGLPWYRADREWVAPALEQRNRRLRALAARTSGRAWLIVSAPRAEERRWWVEHGGVTQVVVLLVAPKECIRRIEADPRRQGQSRWREVVGQWHRLYSPRHGDQVIGTLPKGLREDEREREGGFVYA